MVKKDFEVFFMNVGFFENIRYIFGNFEGTLLISRESFLLRRTCSLTKPFLPASLS